MQKLDLNPNVSTTQTQPSGLNRPPMTPASTVATSRTPMNQTVKTGLPLVLVVIVLGLALAAGSATGFGSYKLFGQKGGTASTAPLTQVASGTLKAGDAFGSQDTKTFKDHAEGYLVAGGVEGEGSHHLVRDSADPVYMTSSITDLDKFIGMQVKVWGETYKAQKAGWLMDVGRVEVVDPKPPVPPGLVDYPDQGGD